MSPPACLARDPLEWRDRRAVPLGRAPRFVRECRRAIWFARLARFVRECRCMSPPACLARDPLEWRDRRAVPLGRLACYYRECCAIPLVLFPCLTQQYSFLGRTRLLFRRLLLRADFPVRLNGNDRFFRNLRRFRILRRFV